MTYTYTTKCAVESQKDEVAVLADLDARPDRKIMISLRSTPFEGADDGSERPTLTISAILTDKAAVHIAMCLLDAVLHNRVPCEGQEYDEEFYP